MVATANTNGNIVSWSNTQIVITIAQGTTSGNLYVQAGGGYSNQVPFSMATPAITAISPSSQLTQGAQVTITGNNFGSVVQMVATANTNGNIVSWSNTQIVITIAQGTTSGNLYVQAGGGYSNQVPFSMATPAITAISPSSQLTEGAQVTITGNNFGSVVQMVATANTNGNIVSWSNTQIVITIAQGTTSGNLYVQAGGGYSNQVPFTMGATFAVAGISPTQGPVGSQVTLTGTGFGSSQGTNSLTFNGTTATATYWTDTSITALVPSGATSGNVVVTVGGASSNAEQFTVIAPSVVSGVSPGSGTAGTQVTISGSGFGTAQAAGTVWLGSTLAPVVSWSATQIVATVSSGSSSGVAKVQQNGLWSNSLQFSVNTAAISSISPISGMAGTQVTIVGSGFGAAQGNGQVWLGTANGTVTSWSDGQVIATVASGSASGNAQILQNGVWSNAIGFNVNIPQISSISPSAGAPGTAVTIYGSGFGTSQGSGTVTLGSMNGVVSSWGDTQVVAEVASGSQNGTVQISQNGTSSNILNFSVPASGTTTNDHITPNLISMAVGDTRNLQVLDSNGVAISGLAWSVTDPTIASLSTDDPPVLTALAVGNVTINAGDGSASLTVYPGALPQGTIQWSDPGDGSGVVKIIPAVPSSTGVADVFALQADGSVQAITADGILAWTSNVSTNNTLLPDFQGGLVLANAQSVQKLDGITGLPYAAYSYSNPSYSPPVLVHTDGTIITADGSSIVGINPLTGNPNFTVAMEQSTWSRSGDGLEGVAPGQGSNPPVVGSPIVAGDGYAYFPYQFSEDVFTNNIVSGQNVFTETWGFHLRVIRVGTDGSSLETSIGDWAYNRGGCSSCSGTYTGANPGVAGVSLITNADQGALLSWSDCLGTGQGSCTPQYWISSIPTAGGASTMATNIGNDPTNSSNQNVEPMLQMQDGSFVGTVPTDYGAQNLMVDFDQFGNLKWSAAGYQPQIATADGGLIATSPSGQAVTFDANGNSTGQMAGLPTQSWRGNEYQYGSIDRIFVAPSAPATPPYASFLGTNESSNNSSPLCHDDRDKLVAEYGNQVVGDISYGKTPLPRFTPACFLFTNSDHSSYFQFSEINKSCPSQNYSPEFGWALIKNPLIAPSTVGYGLDAWRENYGSARTINSGYRDPVQNSSCGSTATGSRHQFGDAVDLRNDSGGVPEWNRMVNAANDADADYVEDQNEPCGLGCVHADWRYHDRGMYNTATIAQ